MKGYTAPQLALLELERSLRSRVDARAMAALRELASLTHASTVPVSIMMALSDAIEHGEFAPETSGGDDAAAEVEWANLSFVYDLLAVTCARSVTLTGWALAQLPPRLTDVSSLRSLDVRHNSIAALPRDLGASLPYLAKLDVSHNDLRALPRSLGRCE
eukprot:CAMPEP_0206060448 /NCGR_PEP_ID=MMETSP1466-20131121/51257_1 /ASSEMBLY_ACC=CAM_ASM_001126 /TAXON_ID=44452 /ORGANISM="Pavlova gyrans, Strain CCMP608" /LENGTH=158 /DNA_ID=CAMNT_0053435783 /DNA_START=137 /DNA_END=610 /DNA_ORIENTATION=+